MSEKKKTTILISNFLVSRIQFFFFCVLVNFIVCWIFRGVERSGERDRKSVV